ncbi:hypothetical protein EDS67_17650 [candidate division KSB1 bacterium]|nr:MAG: hypothetical protein EDS67_17650 [candidate division KSB1 bacterium]MCE7942349.1 hypothetical protein [Chlorobi bacterium CHB1]
MCFLRDKQGAISTYNSGAKMVHTQRRIGQAAIFKIAIPVAFCFFAVDNENAYAQGCPQGSYRWPIAPSQTQQQINGTFMEYRSSSNPNNHRFHDGIDIQAQRHTSVFPCKTNTQVFGVSRTWVGTGADRYPDQSFSLQELQEPYRVFFYTHMETVYVENQDIIQEWDHELAQTNILNHVHFNQGANTQEVNPLTSLFDDRICPFVDNGDPRILNYRIESDSIGIKLPMVGGVYQVTGKVDFLVQAKDSISAPGTDNVSVYGVNFTILGSGGAVVSTNTYFFNEWLSKENLAFVYKKALSSNTTYWYIPTNNLTSNGFWNSTLVADGTYTLQFTVYDTYFREATKEYVISVANHPTTPIINNLLWGDANVTLNFTGAGATSYHIYYDTDTGSPYQGTGADQSSSPIEISVDSTVTKTVTLTGLTNGQT